MHLKRCILILIPNFSGWSSLSWRSCGRKLLILLNIWHWCSLLSRWLWSIYIIYHSAATTERAFVTFDVFVNIHKSSFINNSNHKLVLRPVIPGYLLQKYSLAVIISLITSLFSTSSSLLLINFRQHNFSTMFNVWQVLPCETSSLEFVLCCLCQFLLGIPSLAVVLINLEAIV